MRIIQSDKNWIYYSPFRLKIKVPSPFSQNEKGRVQIPMGSSMSSRQMGFVGDPFPQKNQFDVYTKLSIVGYCRVVSSVVY